MSQTRVYIGGLSPRCRESDLERFFAGYGRLKSILLKRGYGFVEFEDNHDADDAVDNLNGNDMLGYRVQVAHATPRSFRRTSFAPNFRGGRRGGGRGGFNYGRGRGSYRGGSSYNSSSRQLKRGTGYRVIVKNLSSRISWQDLKDFMRQAGEVSYADVCAELNEGTVEYRYYGDLRRALNTLDNAELDGWKIRLIEENRRERSGSGGGGGGSYHRNSGYNNGSRRDRSCSNDNRTRSITGSRSRSRSPVRSRKR
ncbi:hypothetical protein O3M35_002974 [Rhynocoris fuscipes]|uniref:RRM domain-containing protein n=1 Tax=Rhynocoris fuscipes TaxID=488301 RepID=A0AAW1CHI5_9HEMI